MPRLSTKPVFDAKPGYSPKFTFVVGYQRCIDTTGMPGNQQVVGADQFPTFRQGCPNLSIVIPSGLVKCNDSEVFDKRRKFSFILLDSLRVPYAIGEFCVGDG